MAQETGSMGMQQAGFRRRLHKLYAGTTLVFILFIVLMAAAERGGMPKSWIGLAFLIGSGGAIGGAITHGWSGAGLAAGSLALGLLVWLILSVLLGMAFWFAPALVVLRGLAPIDAMKTSLGACLQNFVAFLVFGILSAVAGFVAMLPMGLGMIVLVPVMIGAAYASYLDVFG